MGIRALIVSVAFAVLLCIAVPRGDSSTMASGARLWLKRYAGPRADTGEALAVNKDGTRIFVAGGTDGGLVTGDDYLTIAYNTVTGQQSWAKRYNGPGNGYDYAYAVAVSPDGTKVFVTGKSEGSSTTGAAYATVAYSASTGTVLWAKRYDGPVNGDDEGSSIAVSGDGAKVVVTGQSDGGSATHYDYATVAYDAATGAQRWAKRYNAPAGGDDYAYAVVLSPDGTKAFVSGQSYGGAAAGYDYVTIAYNAATGAQVWAKRYNGPGSGTDRPRFVAVNPTGTKVLVTGSSDGGAATKADYATIAYNASTGSQLWAARHNGSGSNNDYGQALALSGDGSKVFVTGSTWAGSATGTDFGTIAYDASTGAKLWSSRYNGVAAYPDSAYSIGVNPAGTKVFVTGSSYDPAASYDGATVGINAGTGSRLWASRYDGQASGSDGFFPLAVGVDGKVYVTGFSDAGYPTGTDATTAAYEG